MAFVEFLRCSFQEPTAIIWWMGSQTQSGGLLLSALEHAALGVLMQPQSEGNSVLSRLDTARIAWSTFLEAVHVPLFDLPDDDALLHVLNSDKAGAEVFARLAAPHVTPDNPWWAAVSAETEVTALLARPLQTSPRLACPVAVLQEVESHFLRAKKPMQRATVQLYARMLETPPLAVVAFLFAVATGRSEELFYDMPSNCVSAVRGRSCQVRNLISRGGVSRSPQASFCSTPSMLATSSLTLDAGETRLLTRGVSRHHICGGGLLCAVPTESTLEQLVIACEPSTGACRLLCCTSDAITVMCTFALDASSSPITWLDVRRLSGSQLVLQWGAVDGMMGAPLWTCCAGLNETAIRRGTGELFEQVEPSEVDAAVTKQDAVDFTAHGNLLTLWSRQEDVDSAGTRKWSGHHTVACKERELLTTSQPLVDVWGCAQHFIAVEVDGTVSVHVRGVKSATFAAGGPVASACVLFAHSR